MNNYMPKTNKTNARKDNHVYIKIEGTGKSKKR